MTNQQFPALACPDCGSDWMHQESIEWFERSEDQEMVRKTTVGYDGITCDFVPNKGSGNPSYRRQGMRILLTCEWCHGERGPEIDEADFLKEPHDPNWVGPDGPRKVLNIVQHKGQTLMEWARAEELREALWASRR